MGVTTSSTQLFTGSAIQKVEYREVKCSSGELRMSAPGDFGEWSIFKQCPHFPIGSRKHRFKCLCACWLRLSGRWPWRIAALDAWPQGQS